MSSVNVGMEIPAREQKALLSVQDLRAEFPTEVGTVRAVRGVSFDVAPSETVGVVGESGSGKSTMLMAIAGLLDDADVTGSIVLRGVSLNRLPHAEMRKYRGKDIGVVFQNPMVSLNPVLTVGFQVAEAIRIHEPSMSRDEIRDRVVELLGLVGIPNSSGRLRDYPHQYSGGMRQRVMIAMAIAHSPALILADEPTSALDVTIQAQVLDLLQDVQHRTGAAMVLVTHDLGVIAEVADRVLVWYGGRIVESGPVKTVFSEPSHPYTAGLLRSMPGHTRTKLQPIAGSPPNLIHLPGGCAFHPRCPHVRDGCLCTTETPELKTVGADHQSGCHYALDLIGHLQTIDTELVDVSAISQRARQPPAEPVLEVVDVVKHFTGKRNGLVGEKAPIRAVDGVSFELRRGETLALVGESGSGKSTVGRCVSELLDPTNGTIDLAENDSLNRGRRARRERRRRVQIVFQDPFGSLNPRMRISEIVGEPLRVHGLFSTERVADLLTAVGLGPELANRYPHECSGGQRQRVGVARALALDPDVVVLDEPVSALDVSVQAQVLNVLRDLQDNLGVAFLFISHDLSVVRHLADRVAVMYLGKIVEIGRTEEVFTSPRHPYTRALLSAVPVADPQTSRRERVILRGELPSPSNPPSGCNFRTRCPRAQEECASVEPSLALAADREGHWFSCHFPHTGEFNVLVDIE